MNIERKDLIKRLHNTQDSLKNLHDSIMILPVWKRDNVTASFEYNMRRKLLHTIREATLKDLSDYDNASA